MSYYKKTQADAPIVVQGQDVSSSPISTPFSQALNDEPSSAQFKYQAPGSSSPPQPQRLSMAQHQTPEPPERGCRDAFWAFLFFIHLILIGCAAAVNAPLMAQEVGEGVAGGDGWYGGDHRRRRLDDWEEDEDQQQQQQEEEEEHNSNDNEDYDIEFETVHLVMIVVMSTLLAFVISSFALGFMMTCAQPLIKMALFFNIALFAIMMALAFAGGNMGMGIIFLLLLVFALFYTRRVWNKIPFAASNLVTAVTAVRANLGLSVYAYWSVLVLFLWSIVWALSASSTIFVMAGCNANGECEGSVSGFLVFVFFLSYYWTAQIIANVVHVTTAGTVGTWWFTPIEASSCCSKAVRDSYGRSLTTSFGSICLGSLLVAIVQALKEMVYQMRDGEDSILACVAVCILGCIESLVEYFNKWAFVYVGIYGFSFMEAGSNVMQLFRSRGWTTIIADVMVDTVLFMVSLGVALLIGILSAVLGAAMQIEDQATMISAFFVGLLIGYGVCATLFSIVSSGVNTVIVCYAEAPNEFQQNHPDLSEKMRDAWRAAWPSEFAY